MAYVYAIIIDDVIRYIGKGSGRRAIRHLQRMHQVNRARAMGLPIVAQYLHYRMARAWRDGLHVDVVILIDDLTNEDAFAKETELIAEHKARLWNIQPGGKAPPRPTKRSEDFKRRVRESNKKAWADPALRQAQSDAKKVHWLDPSYRDKKSKPQSSEAKEAIRRKAIERWARPEFREKMDAIFNSPETKTKNSLAAQSRWERAKREK